MRVRRVVTGRNARQESAVVSDGEPPYVHQSAVDGGVSAARLWVTGPDTKAPNDGSDRTGAVNSFVPGPGETLAMICEVPPARADRSEAEVAAIEEDMARGLPGLGEHIDEQGWHWTPSVDYWILLEGEMLMLLSDGSETVVDPGTVVIQNGTVHAWRNSGTKPAKIVAVLVGADENAA